MSEHLSPENLESYRQSALPPLELLAVDDHLAACVQCRSRLTGIAPEPLLDAAWQTLRLQLHPGAEQVEHLSYEQLSACVDEQLDGADRQTVNQHLESCEMCAAELQDLRAFRQEVQAFPSPEPEVVKASLSQPRQSWWQKFTEVMTVRWPALAGASAVLLLIAGLFYFQFRAGRQTPPIVATVSPTSTPSNPTPAPIESNVPTEVLALNDGGGRIALDEKGNLLTPQPLPPEFEQIIKLALTKGQVEKPSLSGLNVKTGSLMGGGESAPFKLLEPLGKVIETSQPIFRWQPLAGATSYTVTVYDGNFSRVTASPSLTANEWRSSQSLPRGSILSWQVKATKDGEEFVVPVPPAPEAKFKVLEQAKAEELARARRQFANSHLTLGLLYARAGLLADSERELKALTDANPASPLARKLLRSLTASSR
jgi:predicted anti-sigma-YlaC factor YlaD